MTRKTYAVIGLGKFGQAMAETLANSGCEVLVVDIDEEKVEAIADTVTYAMRANVTETGVLDRLGIANMDVVIVSMADNVEASIMATIFAKEKGVPYVMSKAMSPLHGEILKKIGADEVIFAERAMGVRMARNLMSGGFIEFVELSSKYTMVEVEVPKGWIGKNLRELKPREEYGVNVVGIKEGDEVEININPEKVLRSGQVLMLIGSNEGMEKIWQ